MSQVERVRRLGMLARTVTRDGVEPTTLIRRGSGMKAGGVAVRLRTGVHAQQPTKRSPGGALRRMRETIDGSARRGQSEADDQLPEVREATTPSKSGDTRRTHRPLTAWDRAGAGDHQPPTARSTVSSAPVSRTMRRYQRC